MDSSLSNSPRWSVESMFSCNYYVLCLLLKTASMDFVLNHSFVIQTYVNYFSNLYSNLNANYAHCLQQIKNTGICSQNTTLLSNKSRKYTVPSNTEIACSKPARCMNVGSVRVF